MEEIKSRKRPRIKRNRGDKQWYMIRVATNKENKAVDNLKFELSVNNLDKYVDEVICPKEKKYFLRNKKKVAREKVMFPGYILAKMIPNAEIERLIKKTNFLVEIMSNSNGPEPITEREVTRIFGNVEKSHMEEEFVVGETVEVIDGPFRGFKAEIKDVDSKKRTAKLEVMIFGQPTPIDLKFDQIDKYKK